MIEDIGILQLWEWAIENSPSEYIVWVALSIVAGIAFKIVKPMLDWIINHIAAVFQFFIKRRDMKRQFRKDNNLPNR